MRAVIQRVKFSQVEVDTEIVGEITHGLMVLLGITHDDNQADIERLVKKIINLRIFEDEDGKMNLSVKDIKGGIHVISQFTLHADTKKGNRPSFMRSAPPNISEPLYEDFLSHLRKEFKGDIATGKFGAYMKVSLLNDGPITIIMDTHNPEF
ncbi:MAG: D-aminoacyl-tRNA deacylase [Bacteroidia bacterium]|nr:D-aminoacyl-tRNA deacylase [Bacteroidia bacterium]